MSNKPLTAGMEHWCSSFLPSLSAPTVFFAAGAASSGGGGDGWEGVTHTDWQLHSWMFSPQTRGTLTGH